MRVKLLNSTQNMLDLIYTSARTCYNPGSPIDMFEDVNNTDEDKKLKLVQSCIESGHHSVLEHTQFTFGIEGVSRGVSHQAVRHRHASFSQQSLRYVELKENLEDLIILKSCGTKFDKLNLLSKYFVIKDDNDMTIESCLESLITYMRLINDGIKAEDARAVLPTAIKTNFVMTCNLRELIHICNERLCTRAQLEIRQMVKKMVKEVVEVEPWLKPYLVAKCVTNSGCKEHKPCGYYEAVNKIGLNI